MIDFRRDEGSRIEGGFARGRSGGDVEEICGERGRGRGLGIMG